MLLLMTRESVQRLSAQEQIPVKSLPQRQCDLIWTDPAVTSAPLLRAVVGGQTSVLPFTARSLANAMPAPQVTRRMT